MTRIKVNIKELETASQKYYMSNNSWPRLTNVPYTADEVKEFSKKVYDKTGIIVTLDEQGNYYDIDYSKIDNYIKLSDNAEKYILQNPVGSVMLLDDLTEKGRGRIKNSKPTAVLSMSPSSNISPETEIQWDSIGSFSLKGNSIIDTEFQNKQEKYPLGTHTVKLRVKDSSGVWSEWVEKTFMVTNPVNEIITSINTTYTIPYTGIYEFTVIGGRGGGRTGSSGTVTHGFYGSGVKGEIYLEEGSVLTIVAGQTGGYGKAVGSGQYGTIGAGGGGGSSAILIGDKLLIESKGGDGINGSYSRPNRIDPGNGGVGYTNGSNGVTVYPSNGRGGGENYTDVVVDNIEIKEANQTGRIIIKNK